LTAFRARLDDPQVVEARTALAPLIEDGLVAVDGHELRVLPAGRPFLRNAAAFFDAYLPAVPPSGPMYSRAV
jgi:oxygen-independent coproporphyrinogen-3 oxidase